MRDNLETWINQETTNRGWSIREFGRRIGASPSHAARIANGEARPSVRLCNEIALALGVPPEEVMRKADLLPPEPRETTRLKRAKRLIAELADEEQEIALDLIQVLVDRKRKREARRR